jgi:predicted FMN-binding regulatory protein PaiB
MTDPLPAAPLSDDTLLTVIAHVNRAKREADAATTWATQVIPLDTSQQMAEEILRLRAENERLTIQVSARDLRDHILGDS